MKLRVSKRRYKLARGAISVFAMLTLLAGWQVATAGPAAAAGETTDLVFLVDGSGSIDPTDWQIQKDGLSAALQDQVAFPQDGSIAVAVVQWSFVSATEATRVEVPLTVLDSQATVNTVISQIQAMNQLGALTNPGDAIRAGTDLLLADGEAPGAAEWTLCMSTDGITNSGESLASATAYASTNGVDRYTVIAIEDPPAATGDDLIDHYGPHVFGGGSVTVARNSLELANIIIGSCLGGPVELRAVEVNQAVQDWHNSVPLITNKATAVRVFVQVPPGADEQRVAGRLFGQRGGVDLPGSPLLAQVPGGAVLAQEDIQDRRGELDDGLIFTLPFSWRNGTIELEFEGAGAPVDCQEPAGAGTDPAGDCVVTVTFQDEVTPEVTFVGVRYTSGGTTFEPTTSELFEQMFRFRSIFPVAAIDYEFDTMGNYSSTPGLTTVNSDLAAKRIADGASASSRYYGVLTGGGGGLANGIPGTVSSGFLSGTGARGDTGYARNRGAHELSHNLDRHHAVDPSLPPTGGGLLQGRCGSVASPSAPGHTPFETVNGNVRPVLGPLSTGVDNEIWGLDNRMLFTDTHLAVVDPRQTFELMSYCNGANQGRWISQFTYAGLMGSFPAAADTSSGILANGDFLLVTGTTDFDTDTAELGPTISLAGTPPTPPGGDYRVQLLDSTGAELVGADFTPEEMDADTETPETPTGPPVGLISVPLPEPTEPVASIRVLHNGSPIGSLVATANAPTVDIVSPAGGETFDDHSVTFEWEGNDTDGDPLASTVQYSADDGNTWRTLAVNVDTTALTVPRTDLPASPTARLRVAVSDGVHAVATVSEQFAVANNAPQVAIDLPGNHSVFSSVQNIDFIGAAFDREDGAIDPASLSWSSDVDGPLGAGDELTLNSADLSEGTHVITLTVTDGEDASATATTIIHVFRVEPPPPAVEVDAGGPYAGQEGAPVDVAGTVTALEGQPVTSEWTITPSSNVDPGTTCQFDDPTAAATSVTCTDDGTYTLTLTATDAAGPPVSDTATLRLTNQAPDVSVSAPDDGVLAAVGEQVEFEAPFTDAGSNDIHTCTVDFDDGTPVVAGSVDESTGSGTCTATHSFTEVGPHQVLVTVRDDDGGAATAVVTVVVFLPGEAFAVSANGLVTIPGTPHVTCPPDDSQTLAELNAAIVSVDALTASCTVDPATGETIAAASVDQASLLGGVITISNIESTCVSNVNGITRTSSVGTINGVKIGLGSGSITIPLVATVFYNETTTNPEGQLVQNAIRVQTILGQEIILASCRLG